MLSWSTIIIVAIVCLVCWLLTERPWLRRSDEARGPQSTPEEEGPWPFYAKKLLSAPEQVLYFRLVKALPDHLVLAQVGLSRLLGVKKGNNFQSWYNRINRMTVDFVVCGKDSSTLAVIELDDSSHGRDDRKDADAKKDKELMAAGIRTIRWQAHALPDEAAIRAAVLPPPMQTLPAHVAPAAGHDASAASRAERGSSAASANR